MKQPEPQLKVIKGNQSPEQVERLFIKWRDDNASQHLYSIVFQDDGRAAHQFDRLKLHWFEATDKQVAEFLQTILNKPSNP